MGAALLIAIGSGLGGMLRLALSNWVSQRLGDRFPWGTLAVNLSGALAAGLLVGLAALGGSLAEPDARMLLLLGFLGSYTTVSSLSLQTLALAQSGSGRWAVANVAVSIALGAVAVLLGLAAGLGLGYGLG